jgi:2-methylcitrate dehydratase PrpD
VAAVAKLRSFDAATLENAWGLALSKAAGTMQYLENGAWNKRLHPGFAAHDALVCAALAEAGVIGAAAPFEGKYGFLVGYTGAPHPRALTERLGEEWLLLQTAVKPYPSCRLTHGAVDAALALRDSFTAEERSRVTMHIEISPVSMQIVGGDSANKITPQNSVDAQFSIYFQTAAAWFDGQVDWSTYDKLNAPDRVALSKRISLKVNALLPANAAILTVEVDGKTLVNTVTFPSGEPENWIGDEVLRQKFLSLAGKTYGEQHAARIADRVQALDPDGSVGSVISLLRLPVTAP